MSDLHTMIALENSDGGYMIELSKENLNIDEVMQELVKPLLLAAGYAESLIEEYIEEV